MRVSTLAILSLLSLIGCTRYEYDITRPQEAARHIGGKLEEVLRRDPLEYRMRAVDSRLVMQVYNPTDAPITLQGARSAVVDPKGQSHPLQTQTIAPRSFIKVILPPIRPRIERNGPTFGIGVGTMIGSTRHRRAGALGYDYYDEPRYMTVYEDDAVYWDWDGESDIRLTLVFQQGERVFEHEFVIARKKM